jgi:serine/threonine protein kinase
MLAGDPGSVATDIYALGVTLFRAFTGEFPYGPPDAAGATVRERPKELAALRPDLPSWLQDAIARAIAMDPAKRYRDMGEFAAEMEAGPARPPAPARRPLTLYERAPIQFWRGLAALLALALIVSLLRH